MMQDWFRNAKLGIFIHYGIYAVGDVSESWSFHNGNISYEDYMKQCEGFTASKFDAKKWAELFQKAGAQYVVMTAKHHDGVALFDTGYSDLSVVKKTPAARDLVKEYTAAMREAGLKVGLYYSLIDWSDPRYRTVYPEGMKKEDCLNDIYGSPAGKEEEPEKWQEFLEFNNHQLKELMSNYGTVDLLWFDGDWERSAAQWKMPEFREYLHTLNPNVVLNSRMQGYGDYETPEQGIPLYGPKGEWEFCTTINDSWGYRPSDNDYKSSGQIVRMFCDCITLGGRMLLDIGPKEDGTLDERQEKVLLDLGGWIHDHEEAVFGTEKGLDYNHFLGGSTISADKKTMYLFVYDKPQETLCVKGIKTPVKKVTVLHTGEELRFSYTGSLPWSGIPGTLWIWAGEMSIHPFATVVKVELEDEITYNLGHGEVVTFNEYNDSDRGAYEMKRIIGYVNTADLNHMREEDVRALTVINIAFGLIRDGEVVWDAKDARDGIVSIRKSNPELKIVLSVGGWGADGFSQSARTKEGRERFAASALAIVKEYGLDGIDIDWEYPGTSLAGIASDRSDKENYTLLLAELRKTLDAYREGMLVTTAVGGDVYFALQTDMKEASRYLDYVQLMTYDLQGGFQKVTGHHAALYHSEGNLFDACVEKAVNGFANAGVPMEKLILGVPFYSRKWDGVKGAGCRNGLGMEAETVGGYGGDYGELKESWIGKRGFIRYWDEQAKVPYLFDGETFISYEDCESLGVKIAYLKEKGMGGIMFWEYKCDPSGELLSFIKKNM